MSHLISASILNADFSNLQKEVEMINSSEADWFHLDVMDGVFVPNISRAVAELHRVLAPTGRLSITEEFIDPDYLFPAETIQRLQSAGFRLEQFYGNAWRYTANFVKDNAHVDRNV